MYYIVYDFIVVLLCVFLVIVVFFSFSFSLCKSNTYNRFPHKSLTNTTSIIDREINIGYDIT